MKKKVTIYDIAEEAGVSTATVSRVLAGNTRVNEEMRARVEELVEKYAFRPSALAKGLSNSRRQVIGMLTADLRSPFYAELFVACEQAADRHGYTLLVGDGFDNLEIERKKLETMVAQRVDALIQIGGAVDALVSDHEYVAFINRVANIMPVVIAGQLTGADCYRVLIDHAEAVRLAVEHLTALGHEKIAFVGGAESIWSTVEKKQRFLQLADRHQLHCPPHYVALTNSYNHIEGFRAMTALLNMEDMPTAVVCINDSTAFGVVSAIHRKGLSVPGDISVVGCDNTEYGAVCQPPLTTIDYDYAAMGELIVQTASSAIEGETRQRMQIIPVRLIERQSTAAPRE